MKIRKRMGMPKVRKFSSLIASGRTIQPVPEDMAEMRRDQARDTIMAEDRSAANKRPVLEVEASSQADLREPTPVKFAERIASLSGYFTSAPKH